MVFTTPTFVPSRFDYDLIMSNKSFPTRRYIFVCKRALFSPFSMLQAIIGHTGMQQQQRRMYSNRKEEGIQNMNPIHQYWTGASSLSSALMK